MIMFELYLLIVFLAFFIDWDALKKTIRECDE